MHRRVRRTPARPRRSRQCIGPRAPDGSAPRSQPDGEGRLVRREPRQRQRAGRHGGRAGRGEVGVGAPGPPAEPPQPRRRQPSTCFCSYIFNASLVGNYKPNISYSYEKC